MRRGLMRWGIERGAMRDEVARILLMMAMVAGETG